jgi:gluconolactonase
LWRIGSDGAVTRCYDGIQLTNGLGVSPDGTRLYHNDTLPRLVWVSDLSDAGLPVGRRVFHELRDGMPDGMAVDEAGAVWVAAIGAGKIVRITPDGEEDVILDTPMPYVSALCFSGSDRRDLCVTTFGGPPYDPEHTGSVISTRVDVAGAAVTPARV